MSKYVLYDEIETAYRTSTPLVCIQTPDPLGTQLALAPILAKQDVKQFREGRPVITWNTTTGLEGLNKAGEALVVMLTEQAQGNNPFAQPGPAFTQPADFLRCILNGPTSGAVFIAHHLDRWWHDAVIMQAIQSLRDVFKGNENTLYMLIAPTERPPSELQYDVVTFHEPRPTDADLARIIQETLRCAGAEIDQSMLEQAVSAVRGLPNYSAEQEVAISLINFDGTLALDIEKLRKRQREVINSTAGLTIYSGDETFANVGGLQQLKWLIQKICTGKKKIQCIVYVDEIDKSPMAHQGALDSGVSDDAHGVLLNYMQDHDQTGILLVGPPGTGKSLIAKATGNEFDILAVKLDLGSTKDPKGLVGGSEHRIRAAMDTLYALSGGNALFIATSNDVTKLSPELRDRFRLGVVFQDLPTEEEKHEIWEVQQLRYPEVDFSELPNDEGWSGRNIWTCADNAWTMDISLQEATKLVVPVAKSYAERIKTLRQTAHNRYLSASHEGVYTYVDARANGGGRNFKLEEGNDG